MSWNLLIYRAGNDEEMASLGSFSSVSKALGETFPDLVWPTPRGRELNIEGGFTIEWTVSGRAVCDGYTCGGFHHLRQLATVCKQRGWRIADPQEGEDLSVSTIPTRRTAAILASERSLCFNVHAATSANRAKKPPHHGNPTAQTPHLRRM